MPISARETVEASRFTPYQALLIGLLVVLQFVLVAATVLVWKIHADRLARTKRG